MQRRGARLWTWLVAAAVLAPGLGAEPAGEDWPQFRGIHRDGVSQETGLLDAWPEGEPKELWRIEIGEGYSGISVAGGKLYTMYSEDAPEEETAAVSEEAAAESEEGAAAPEKPKGVEYAAAYDAATGEQLWRIATGEKIETQFGNGPRSTPTVDGDAVYVLGAHGELMALATADGGKRWEVNLPEAFGGNRPHWGYSTSALVEGDMLLIESGGPEGKSYAALSKATGEVQWTTGDASGAGYNSPLAVTVNGTRQFVYVGGEALRAIDVAGNELWSHSWPEGETHAMPVFIPPDRFFASGAEGVGAAMVRVTAGDDGASTEEVWKNRIFKNHFSSSVLSDGHLYGFDNATLKCISAETGEQAWAKRGLGKGSLILADGHLLVLSDRGKLIQAEATSSGYVEKGSVQALEGKCWTAPTLARGVLYLRNHNQMVAYDLKG